jgi:hypothetical protein
MLAEGVLGAALLAGKTVSATVARERTPEVLKAERTRVGRVAMERMAMEQVINAALLKADMFAVCCCCCLLCLLLLLSWTRDNLDSCYDRLLKCAIASIIISVGC